MPKYTTFVASTALALVLATAATSQDADTVIVTVDGTDITLGEMIITRAQLPQQYQALPAEVLFEGILEQLIQQQVLADTLDAEPSRVTYAVQNERRSLMAGEAINDLSAETISDEAVQAAYDAAFLGADPIREYNASHILVDTEEEAQAVRARLDAGADFAETAREISNDTSGPGGGELGWFSDGMMVEPFQAAVQSLEPGAISDPVETQFGWHVIKLNETRIQEAPPLDAVRDQLVTQIQQEALEARLNALTDAAQIDRIPAGEIDPAILSNIDLLRD